WFATPHIVANDLQSQHCLRYISRPLMTTDTMDATPTRRPGWLRESQRPPLVEVFRSVRLDPGAPAWRRFLTFVGPGYLVAVGYMDPGNWATSLAGGSRFGYALLFVALLSNIMAIILQSLCARLAIGSGKDLAQATRDAFPHWIAWPLWALAEIAIIATDLAEVIGTAIGLQLIFGVPLEIGILITTLDVFLILFLQSKGFRWIEAFIVTLLGVIALCFVVQIVLANPDRGQVAGGALGAGIEGADRFELAAEEVEPQRRFRAGREEIDEAATHRVFAGLAHGRDAQIAVERGPLDQLFAVDHLPGFRGKAHAGDGIARRQLLDQRVDGGEHDEPAGGRIGQRRERRHPGGNGDAVGRDAVIRQAVPSRQRKDRVPRHHGTQHVFHALQAAAVARDEHGCDGGLGRGLEPLLDEACQHRRLHAVGDVDDGSGRERLVGHAVLRRKAMMVRRSGASASAGGGSWPITHFSRSVSCSSI